MRNTESPYLADLFAISLRWLALFVFTILLGTGGNLDPLTISTLILLVLWNSLVSGLAIFNRRLPIHRYINVAMDTLFSLFLFMILASRGSLFFWVSMLPLSTAAVYFGTMGAISSTAILTLLQVGYQFLAAGLSFEIQSIALLFGFNLLAGIVTAGLSTPLIYRLRRTYMNTINQRREGERRVQRMERDRTKALFSLIETFSSTLNYQTVLDTALDTAISGMGMSSAEEQMMVGAVLLFGDENELEIRAARGFAQPDMHTRLPADQGALFATLKAGEAHLVTNPGEDPELSKLLTMHKRKIALCLPLVRGMNAFGLLVFAHNDADFFYPDRIETLQMLSNQAVIALQNARLYQDLAHEKERIVQTQEDAQKKLARDLHDGPTQSVSGIAMRINIARKHLERALATSPSPVGAPDRPLTDGLSIDRMASVQEAIDELSKIEDLARRTTQEIRHMLFTLRPLILESEGLLAALRAIAEKMHDLYQQNVLIDIDEQVAEQLDMPRQTVVFYLAEESVNNARKHANATEIWVRLKYAGKETNIAMLEIADNGQGFDVKEVLGTYDRRGSMGMLNLRERTDLVNGLLRIDSVPGKGTHIRIFIPLTEQAADRLHHTR